ncbi:hypothetical protein C7S20_16745 [Christiangramia fulva]|uniref:Uncharacterized protein n=1 Tax=Christiangramia fulva TaxID=2126553 RepID=A0A2R3Z931_9FLAO|nr:hypothetical protein [Christiangramia fulva]AVR46777.1 hypothetical protein C7S20_16745 [Christiangramia fulva]
MKINGIPKDTEIYSDSIFNLGFSPEYSNGEVSLAALYRHVGWKLNKKRFPEDKVNEYGEIFFDKEKNSESPEKDDILDLQDWKKLILSSLASPKMPRQKRINPTLYPYVPDCALYSNSAREGNNPWNPGNLLERLVIQGSGSQKDADELWEKLFVALSSNFEIEEEDIFARLVTKHFYNRRPEQIEWDINQLSLPNSLEHLEEEVKETSPAARFFKDLNKILDLKSKLSRRQWLAILESCLRIGGASHVLWICRLNTVAWEYLRAQINDQKEISENELLNKFKTDSLKFWKIEEKATEIIQKEMQFYVRAQVGINYILKKFDDEGVKVKLGSIRDLYRLGEKLNKKIRTGDWKDDILLEIHNIYEANPRIISCKDGRTKNLFEFIRHSLGQKQTAESHKKNYDQSYWLQRKGNRYNSPWILELGPVSILSMVYCCSYKSGENRTILDLLDHLGNYGISMSQTELEQSNLMQTLQTLQVVQDSPDAEGGMVIINPF